VSCVSRGRGKTQPRLNRKGEAGPVALMDIDATMVGNHSLDCQMRQAAIRRIKSQDDAAIARRLAEIYQTVDLGTFGEAADSLSEIYSGERSAYFVMERETGIVGGAGIAPLSNDLEHIADLQRFVLLPMSGKIGQGIRLLIHCLEAADLLGYRACYAEVFSGDSDLNEIFRFAGFQPFGKPLLRDATLGWDAIHYLKLGLHRKG
jgi:putative acetyltransferase